MKRDEVFIVHLDYAPETSVLLVETKAACAGHSKDDGSGDHDFGLRLKEMPDETWMLSMIFHFVKNSGLLEYQMKAVFSFYPVILR